MSYYLSFNVSRRITIHQCKFWPNTASLLLFDYAYFIESFCRAARAYRERSFIDNSQSHVCTFADVQSYTIEQIIMQNIGPKTALTNHSESSAISIRSFAAQQLDCRFSIYLAFDLFCELVECFSSLGKSHFFFVRRLFGSM